MSKQSILNVMRERPIIGDGSYVITLEKRGYVKGGPFTVEAVMENPETGKSGSSVHTIENVQWFKKSS